MAGCRSTLSMSKIKIKISETKFLSFYKTLINAHICSFVLNPICPPKSLFFLNVTLILRNWDCFMTCDILAWQRENLLNVAWLLVTTCKCRWCCLLLSLVSHVSFIKSERSEQWSKQSHSNIFVKYYILHTFFT